MLEADRQFMQLMRAYEHHQEQLARSEVAQRETAAAMREATTAIQDAMRAAAVANKEAMAASRESTRALEDLTSAFRQGLAQSGRSNN